MCLNASEGSIFDAFRAGYIVASVPTKTERATAPAARYGSKGIVVLMPAIFEPAVNATAIPSA